MPTPEAGSPFSSAFEASLTRREVMRRALAVGLSMSASGSLLAGCISKPPSQENTDDVKPPVLQAPDPNQFIGKRWPVEILPPPVKYDGLVITQSPPFWNPDFKKGENTADNVHSRFLLENLGVYYRYAWDFNSDEANLQKWSLTLAGGSLPEFLSCIPTQIYDRLRRADKLEDIRPIWEATASDLTKRKFEYPDSALWDSVREGEGVFGLPYANASASADNILWYRKDLLDKIGLQAPKSLDEIESVSTELVERKLAKFGLISANDTSSGTVTYIGSLDPVWGAFGVMPTYWVPGADGSVVYGSVQPGVKEGLALLRRWYEKRVLDPEFFNTPPSGDNGVTSKAVAGYGAMYFGPFWVASTLGDVTKNIKSAEMAFVGAPPAGPDGRQGRAGSKLVYGLNAFSKGTSRIKIEAVINHLNWLLDRYDRQWQTHDYFSAGSRTLFEGYDFTIEDGKLTPGSEQTWEYPGGAEDPVYRYPGALADYFAGVDQLAAKPKAEQNLAEQSFVSDPAALLGKAAYQEALATSRQNIPTLFDGGTVPTLGTAGGNLGKLEVEALSNIIAGRAPLDAFDDFVKQWKAQGGDQLTREVNEWRNSRQ